MPASHGERAHAMEEHDGSSVSFCGWDANDSGTDAPDGARILFDSRDEDFDIESWRRARSNLLDGAPNGPSSHAGTSRETNELVEAALAEHEAVDSAALPDPESPPALSHSFDEDPGSPDVSAALPSAAPELRGGVDAGVPHSGVDAVALDAQPPAPEPPTSTVDRVLQALSLDADSLDSLTPGGAAAIAPALACLTSLQALRLDDDDLRALAPSLLRTLLLRSGGVAPQDDASQDFASLKAPQGHAMPPLPEPVDDCHSGRLQDESSHDMDSSQLSVASADSASLPNASISGGLGRSVSEGRGKFLVKLDGVEGPSKRLIARKCSRAEAGDEGAAPLFATLGRVRSLLVLDLGDMGLKCGGVKTLAQRLINLPGSGDLTAMSLQNNRIGARGMRDLRHALPVLSGLQMLDLEGNELGAEGVRALAAGLGALKQLRQLFLASNGVGPDGAAALAPNLGRLTALQVLDLDNNAVGGDGARALSGALGGLRRLLGLALSRNGIGADGAAALAPALRQLKRLQALQLGGNALGGEGARELGPPLASLRRLMLLSLSHNGLDHDGVAALSPHLAALANLEALNLNGNRLGDYGLQTLLDVVPRLAKLRFLELHANGIGPVGVGAASKLTGRCPNLVVLVEGLTLGDAARSQYAPGGSQGPPGWDSSLDIRFDPRGADSKNGSAFELALRDAAHDSSHFSGSSSVGVAPSSPTPSSGELTSLSPAKRSWSLPWRRQKSSQRMQAPAGASKPPPAPLPPNTSQASISSAHSSASASSSSARLTVAASRVPQEAAAPAQPPPPPAAPPAAAPICDAAPPARSIALSSHSLPVESPPPGNFSPTSTWLAASPLIAGLTDAPPLPRAVQTAAASSHAPPASTAAPQIFATFNLWPSAPGAAASQLHTSPSLSPPPPLLQPFAPLDLPLQPPVATTAPPFVSPLPPPPPAKPAPAPPAAAPAAAAAVDQTCMALATQVMTQQLAAPEISEATPRDEALHLQLDSIHAAWQKNGDGDPSGYLMGKYIVGDRSERRGGGQGLVVFVTPRYSRKKRYAVKFYLQTEAFRTERTHFCNHKLHGILPDIHDLHPSSDRHEEEFLVLGRPLPPMVVMDRGEPLDEWQRRSNADFASAMHILLHLVERVATIHAAGLVHRDVKPANVILNPIRNEWDVIDFGCAAEIGTEVAPIYTPSYAAPEAVVAYTRGQRMVADPAVDVWALGVIAWELFTRSRVFSHGTHEQILDVVEGRRGLPWEVCADGGPPPPLHKLGFFKSGVLRMLAREPEARPTLAATLRGWRRHLECTRTGVHADHA